METIYRLGVMFYSGGSDYPDELYSRIMRDHKMRFDLTTYLTILKEKIYGEIPQVILELLEDVSGDDFHKYDQKKNKDIAPGRNRSKDVIRVIMDVNNHNFSSNESAVNGRSHIVKLLINNNPEFINSDMRFSLSVNCNLEQYGDTENFYLLVRQLIEDILLDIAMFYTFKGLYKKYRSSKERQEFSKLKRDFILDKQKESIYGKLDGDCNYLSIANICREENTSFNYDEYIKLWYEFLDSVFGCNYKKNYILPEILKDDFLFTDASNRETASKCSDLSLDEHLKNHKAYRQMQNKFKNDLYNLAPGEYIIIRRIKNIKNKVQYSKIVPWFNKKYAKSKMNIVDIGKVKEIKEHGSESIFCYYLEV